MKKCGNCFKTKALQEFYLRRRGADPSWRQNHCKACHPEIARSYRLQALKRRFGENVRIGRRVS